MHTLHIEHPISDFATWKQAFDKFAELRSLAGVRSHRVAQPVDDSGYVVIDLDFDAEAAAVAFLEILRTRVWGVAANSPALAGDPVARILVVEDLLQVGVPHDLAR
ncbi:hypothetical protein ACHIPZ_03815 [Antrihabitans sp. NCIMB 15449]|jgi:hypothetical protein|uniref:Cyclase n=1 Tax=Antrihabitans spumae TaxID=3373370 RepID=A0ABW7JH83_9NOCA